jgi:hypothetical protein
MKKFKVLGVVALTTGLVVLVILFLIGFFRPKGAGLLIEANPQSLVYINGEEVGTTPFETTRQPGEISLKIQPESAESPLPGFETNLNLTSGIQTVVRREFAPTQAEASGEIISFEKTGGKEASISFVAEPDAAKIAVDGLIRGYSPYKIASITPGNHQITFSATGFKDKNLSVKTQAGFKLILVVKLAVGEVVSPSPTPTPKPENVVMVKILSTPNNFLRVRSEASSTASELARVESGKSFVLIEESVPSGWFKIEYEESKEGWVSAEYSQKVESLDKPIPSPTPNN